jgi:hypothetical protein
MEKILGKFGFSNSYLARSRSLASSTVAFCILCLVVPAFAQGQDSVATLPDTPSASATVGTSQTVDHSLTFGDRVHVYRRSVFNPETIIRAAFGSGINQWRNQPPGWGQGAEGYGDRIGSALGRTVISKTITFGFAAIDGEDPRYFPSKSRGGWARTKYAFVSAFVSPTASSHQIPAFSHFAGTYGAAFISNAWYPDKQATAAFAARRGSISLGVSIGLNLLREFVPHFNSIAPK